MRRTAHLARIGIAATFILGLFVAVGCSMFGPSKEDSAQGDLLKAAMADYTQWEIAPGYDEWERGTSGVHGKWVRMFVNDVVVNDLDAMPFGSIIVKESYNSDRELQNITVMQRIEGYDPEHYDWFWARYNASGELTNAGSMSMCYDCHKEKGGDDYSTIN